MRQPYVRSVSDFIFLASAYEDGWTILFLALSSSSWQCTVSVLKIAELAIGGRGVTEHSRDFQNAFRGAAYIKAIHIYINMIHITHIIYTATQQSIYI